MKGTYQGKAIRYHVEPGMDPEWANTEGSYIIIIQEFKKHYLSYASYLMNEDGSVAKQLTKNRLTLRTGAFEQEIAEGHLVSINTPESIKNA